MKDILGHTLEVKDLVGYIRKGRSITVGRIMRFTPKKVEIVFRSMKYNYSTGAVEPTHSKLLVDAEYLIKLHTITPEIQETIDKDEL